MFVVLFVSDNRLVICKDKGNISRLLGISRETVVNWFRGGPVYYSSEKYGVRIWLDPEVMRSVRGEKGEKRLRDSKNRKLFGV